MVRPAGRTHLEARVLCRPDRGNCQPDGKGVHREVESQRKPQAKRRPDEQKSHRRRPCRVRRPISSKPGTCTEGMDVYAAGISVKVGAHYPGRSVRLPRARNVERRFDERAEVSRGHSSRHDCRRRAEPVKGSWTDFLFTLSRCLERGPKAGSNGRNPRGKAGRLKGDRH